MGKNPLNPHCGDDCAWGFNFANTQSEPRYLLADENHFHLFGFAA
jgi:hypothetical protein